MSKHQSISSSVVGANMTIGSRLLAVFAVGLALCGAGCMEVQPEVNRVQTNLIDKSVFEGDWWYTRTVIGLPDDAAWAIGDAGSGAPWPGAMANFDIASQSGVIGRIRWVIDENFLYAYRASEIIPGSNPDARDPEFRGSPLAVFRIINHVDVRREFNPVTGEPSNVISENTDRRWYDRQFVRVDWSQNLVTFGQFGAGLEIDALFGVFRREPANLGITDEGNLDLPAAWAPQFVTVGEDEDYRFRSEWPTGSEDTVHYMSFVTQEMWTPLQCFGNSCGTSIAITMRDAFLRVPPEHDYAVEVLSNSEYDRFGIIRTEQRTYIRGGQPRAALGQFCRADADCETDACDLERNICVGGLTDELGETDYLTYYRLRHNFYVDSLTDQECTADWQCSNRYGLGSGERANGSVCDQYARRCTIPLADRVVRPVRYRLSPGYPTYLLRSAFEVVSMWNEAFMQGNRAIHGRSAPSGEPVSCQSADPTQYCFCGDTISSPEVDPVTRSCPFRIDFFQPPNARGVTSGEDYDCWIAGAGDAPVADVANPTEFSQYDPAVWTQLHFVGSECMLVLDVNSCDRDRNQACEQLGDIRYNMFNFVTAAASGFCGVMQPMQDPITGEAIVSPVNMGGQCLDNFGIQPLVYWPILRGEQPADDLLSGDDIRRYFENLGNVQPPVGIAPGGGAGYDPSDPSRPALPVDLGAHFRDHIERLRDQLISLRGPEGRAQLLSDRLHTLDRDPRGRELMRRLGAAVASEGFPAPNALEQLAASAMDAPGAMAGRAVDVNDTESLARVSPFADEFLDGVMQEMEHERALLQSGTCMMHERPALVLQSQYGEYWAEAFRGRELSEARIRWAQAWHRAVMQHELGHGLGLEHNFAATFDRDNYFPAYYRIARENPLPQMEEFDRPANGGNGDGVVTADEAQRYYAELQRVRQLRNRAGLGNFTASSTMDYPGDLSDIMGIGFYDRAAIYYNYFNAVETYVGDPRLNAPGTSMNDILQSDITPRAIWSWYRGGESCTVDEECPSSAASGNVTPGQVVTQRCVTNPRFSAIQRSCGGAEHCVCSNFDQDFIDYQNGLAYRDFTDPLDYYPVVYLFCSNSRLNDISWCNVFDAGESFQEAVANWRREWENRYPTSYFRRFRRPFGVRRRYQGIQDAAKVYQHLLFRYFYNEVNRGRTLRSNSFGSDPLPLGFNDQFLASIDTMNWLGQIASLPDVGSYEFDAANNTYRHMGEELDMPGADLTLEPGQGYYTWSRYQEGMLGFFRMERRGVFWDKLFALQALTIRDWGTSFTIDERYYINFHSLFPIEVTELFGGYILDEPTWFAPRVDTSGPEPIVQYPNWWRGGDCRVGPRPQPCRGPNFEEYTNPTIADTNNDILRVYATAFALSEFPVFFDTSWESRLAIFNIGNGDEFTIPDTQGDGSRTCAYRTPREEAGGLTTITLTTSGATCTDIEDADYITYNSDRLHSTFVAVKVRSRITYNLEEEQLGFQFLRRLVENQDRKRELEAIASGRPLTPAERDELRAVNRRIESDESFLQTLIQLQRIFGINSYL
ncbi:MAG: hypothetical protein OHK0013_22090 [Sandaracinaceae bacterium]